MVAKKDGYAAVPRDLALDSSEEAADAELAALQEAPEPLLLGQEPEPEPEPEAAVTFDMPGEELVLHVVRKISPFMRERAGLQDKANGEDYAAEAMAAIPGLQGGPARGVQLGGSSHVLVKVTVKADRTIDQGLIVEKANKALAASGNTIEVVSLLLKGEPLDKHVGKWADLAEHIQGAKGSRTLELQAKLFSVDQQAVSHALAMSKKDRQSERDLDGKSAAGTPNCAVDPLSRSVPVRAVFRLQKMSNVDLEKRQFTATFYLELQWVEQGSTLSRPRAGSMTPRQPLARASSGDSLSPLETQSANRFDPKVFFENRVGDERDSEWTTEQNPCTSAEQLQRFWAVDPEAVKVDEYTLFRSRWNGCATFAIDDRDICDAPLDPVQLKIKIRCPYNTSRVMPQETMSGLLMPTVVAQEGHVSFIKVDMGNIDRPPIEMALNCVKDSLKVSSKVPTQHKIEEVAAKADKPSIDLCFEFKERLLPHRVSLVLPSALIGMVSMASVWYAGEGDRALVNAILLVGAASRISPSGRGGMKTLGTVNLFLIGTVLLVSVLTVADLVKANRDDDDTRTLAKAMQIVQLSCFGLWVILTLLLCFTRLSLSCCLRHPAAPARSKREPLPEPIINMTGSLLHTQWRKDRADGFNGEMVPRWKTIDEKESEEWLRKFDRKQREELKGIVYATAPIPKADQKACLNELQSITDAARVPDALDSDGVGDALPPSVDGGRISPTTSKMRNYKHKMDLSIKEVNEMVAKYISEHPDDERTTDVMHICDINNDFSVLPPSWQKDNLKMAIEALTLCQEHPDMRDDELSAEVHKLWLERNDWAKAGPLGVDFDALPTVEQAKDLSVVMVSKLVLKTLTELEHDFKIMDADSSGTLDASEVSDALAVYGGAHGGAEAKAVDYKTFVQRVLPDVEQQIAQQLFSLGVNMVSVMEQINQQKRADSNTGSVDEHQGWASATDGLSADGLTIPPGKSGFHIFISYRRTGLAHARSVKQALEQLGFRCFMDFEALNVGDFQENLERNLAGTPVVVVLLTPGAFSKDARWPGGGRAPTDGTVAIDWLQREIQLSLQMGKLIIPVRSSDFDIEAELFASVPKDDIGVLPTLNIIELNDDYFQASIDKIVDGIDKRENMSTYVGDAQACDSDMPEGIGGGVNATAATAP